MFNKKLRYGLLFCAVALFSGCLTREVQNALAIPDLPYGAGNLYSGYGAIPSDGYMPQRAYSSASGTSAVTGTPPARGYTAASRWKSGPEGATAGAGMGAPCGVDIQAAEMDKLQRQSQQMQADVKQLCAGGRRDEAMRRAMAFGKEMAANSAMQKLKTCGAGMARPMPGVANTEETSPRHICDSFN